MTSAPLAVGCGLLGVAAGPLLHAVIERVPAKQPMLPLLPLRRPASDPDAGAPLAVSPDEADPPAAAPVPPVPPLPRPVPVAVVPVANGVLFAAAGMKFGADWVLPAYLMFFGVLLALSVIDLQLQIIPNRIVYPAIFTSLPLLALAAALEHDWHRLETALISAAACWLALLIVHLISPGGMGFGDVRLSFLLGLFLGWLGYGHALTGLFLGFLLGALVGGGLVVLRIRSRTDHVPFGPFLAAGAAVAIFWGEPLVNLWLGNR